MPLSLCLESITRFILEMFKFGLEHILLLIIIILLSFLKDASKWVLAGLAGLISGIIAFSASLTGLGWISGKVILFLGGASAFFLVSWILVFLILNTEANPFLKIIALIPTAWFGTLLLTISPIIGFSLIAVLSFILVTNKTITNIIFAIISLAFIYLIIFMGDNIICKTMNDTFLALKEIREQSMLEAGMSWITSLFS